MSDPGFHEIQLSGKQLVFLFMALVVSAVVIFLLGVSVGKGVRGALVPASAAEMSAPGDTTVPATPPAGTPIATKVTPNDLDYREKLQGQGAAPAAGATAASATGSAAAASKPAEPPPAAAAENTPSPKPNLLAMTDDPAAPAAKTPAPAAGSTKAAEPAPPLKTAAADASWVVQIDAFRNKATADDLVKQLKAKGYAAFSVNSATLFKVRVGPFSDKGEADKVAGRLVKDGYKPLVTR
jgi:DedD protein